MCISSLEKCGEWAVPVGRNACYGSYKHTCKQCRMGAAGVKPSDCVIGFDVYFSSSRSPEGEMDSRLDKKRKNAQTSCVIS